MEFATVACLERVSYPSEQRGTPTASFLELLRNGGRAPRLQCSKLKPSLPGEPQPWPTGCKCRVVLKQVCTASGLPPAKKLCLVLSS